VVFGKAGFGGAGSFRRVVRGGVDERLIAGFAAGGVGEDTERWRRSSSGRFAFAFWTGFGRGATGAVGEIVFGVHWAFGFGSG